MRYTTAVQQSRNVIQLFIILYKDLICCWKNSVKPFCESSVLVGKGYQTTVAERRSL